MDTFKGSFGDKQFYFKPKDNGAFYLVEPYMQKGVKPFKVSKRDGAAGASVWHIAADQDINEDLRGLEADFSKLIEEKQALSN